MYLIFISNNAQKIRYEFYKIKCIHEHGIIDGLNYFRYKIKCYKLIASIIDLFLLLQKKKKKIMYEFYCIK